MNVSRIAALVIAAALVGGCAARSGVVPGTGLQSVWPASRSIAARPSLGLDAGVGVRAQAACTDRRPGYGHCDAVYRTDVAPSANFVSFYQKACTKGNAVCYAPNDLRAAYTFPSTQGTGQTVAVVDAYDDPTAETDLAKYRSNFGLPPCTSASGCFLKVAGNGSTTKFPRRNAGWMGEESLDVDMVSAVCPNCKIVLVEALNSSFKHFAQAEDTAVRLGATVISNSWGGNEYAANDPAYDHPGVAITASAGDDGYNSCADSIGCVGPQDPAAFDTVIAVGGTRLLPAASTSRGWSETTWNCYAKGGGPCLFGLAATGSGCARLSPRPAWQTVSGCPKRAYNDVAAVADPVTGVLVIEKGEWFIFGGTSVASPIVAAAIALAGNGASLNGAQNIWKSRGAEFNDVTVGNDVIPAANVRGHGRFPRTCAKAYAFVCTARAGYDGPTGWGTPNGVGGL